MLVHGGGGWGERNRHFVAPLLPVLDRSGLAWFTIDYRLAPKYTYPAPMEDVQDAIRWVKKHAKEYRVDPNRIVLMGESAGGHLVALVAARPTPDTQVFAVVPFYTPTDLNGVIDDIPELTD
jgi:alpha-L-fucosidase 2